MIKSYKKGFSLAEALITLVIISLVMAATMPIVVKSQNSPSEAPWKYITQGDLTQNASVFTALGETSSAVFGHNRIPVDSHISAANKDNVYATRLNPRIAIVTRHRSNGPVVGRHLIDFYERESTGTYTSIGKVSFDQFYNLALGQNALDAIKSDTGSPQKVGMTGSGTNWNELNKTAAGDIDTSATLGAANTAVGQYSMGGNERQNELTASNYNITGVGNTALGAFSMRRLTNGNVNTGLGLYSLHVVQSGSNNTAVGGYTLKMNTGAENNAIGAYALAENTTGAQNTALGVKALKSNTTGNSNIALGNFALKDNTTGSYNIVIGNYAYQANTTGNGNIIIGNNVGVANSSNKLFIGGCSESGSYTNNGTDAMFYGDLKDRKLNINASELTLGQDDGSETIIKGTAYIVKGGDTKHMIATKDDIESYLTAARLNTIDNKLSVYPPTTIYSDARLKNIIGDNTAGLKEILQIQVKNYTMKRDKKKEVLVGVIAQELQKVFPNSVSEGRDGYLRIKRDEIFYACVNAIKELNNMIKDLTAKITGLDEKIRILEDRNKLNEEKIAALERQNKLFEERLNSLENSTKKTLVKKMKEKDTVKTEVETVENSVKTKTEEKTEEKK